MALPAGFSDDSEDGWSDYDGFGDRVSQRREPGAYAASGAANINWDVVSNGGNNNGGDVTFEDPDKQKLLDRTKKCIKAVLLSSKGSTDVYDLKKEYQEQFEEDIPFQKFGFQTLERFLESIPSVCQLRNWGHTLVIEGVADSGTRHIKDMIRAQKSGGGKKKKRVGGGYGYGGGSYGYGGGSRYSGGGGFSIGGGGGNYSFSPPRTKSDSVHGASNASYSSSRGKVSSSKVTPVTTVKRVAPPAASQPRVPTADLRTKLSSARAQAAPAPAVNSLPVTTDSGLVLARLKELLEGRKFGFLFTQVEKLYEKKWDESLPKDWHRDVPAVNFVFEKRNDKDLIIYRETETKTQEDSKDKTMIEFVKKFLHPSKKMIEDMYKLKCGSEFDANLWDRMEATKLVTVEMPQSIVKWNSTE